ncbi:ATP-binding protein [Ideonella sp. DXS22W]|uniref:histidine kinase n=1 Tax=Pseudaquabacterium inlustre TaxID=2984192 RepID=A0ABU9CFN1_9BURK
MKRDDYAGIAGVAAPVAPPAPTAVPLLESGVWHCPGSARCGPLRESQLTLGMLAHDLNGVSASMLAAIGQLALQLPPDHPLQALTDQVRRSAARARELVHQMLDPDRQRGERREPCDLGALLEDVAELLRPGLPDRQRLSVRRPAAPQRARVDSSRFLRALINLCRNALQAMDERPGHIQLQVEPTHDPAGMVRVVIQDDGPGMDSQTLAQACQPFYSTRRAEGGHGLGLAMVDRFVRDHGGQLQIDSAPGRGTRVVMLLPLQAPDVDAPPESAAACPSACTPACATAGPTAGPPDATATQPRPVARRLLYVDDDPVLRLLAEHMLGAAGYEVTLAETATQARALMDAHASAFDIVVSDVHLPDATGFDVLAAARGGRHGGQLYLVSGNCNAELVQRAHQEGVQALIAKDRFFDPVAQADGAAMAGQPGRGGPDGPGGDPWFRRFHQI